MQSNNLLKYNKVCLTKVGGKPLFPGAITIQTKLVLKSASPKQKYYVADLGTTEAVGSDMLCGLLKKTFKAQINIFCQNSSKNLW